MLKEYDKSDEDACLSCKCNDEAVLAFGDHEEPQPDYESETFVDEEF